jgi:hypothetical protein
MPHVGRLADGSEDGSRHSRLACRAFDLRARHVEQVLRGKDIAAACGDLSEAIVEAGMVHLLSVGRWEAALSTILEHDLALVLEGGPLASAR